MPPPRFPVDVVIERVPLANRWATEQWRVGAVEPEHRGAVGIACERLADQGNIERWRCSGLAIELARSEAEGYYLNISSPEPKAFVVCRTAEPGTEGTAELRAHLVTVSYNEAGRLLDGGEQVEAVALHPAILAWMQPFVAEHYRPEPRRKARRNELYERESDVVPRFKPDR
jgi:hypothetical protein